MTLAFILGYLSGKPIVFNRVEKVEKEIAKVDKEIELKMKQQALKDAEYAEEFDNAMKFNGKAQNETK